MATEDEDRPRDLIWIHRRASALPGGGMTTTKTVWRIPRVEGRYRLTERGRVLIDLDGPQAALYVASWPNEFRWAV